MAARARAQDAPPRHPLPLCPSPHLLGLELEHVQHARDPHLEEDGGGGGAKLHDVWGGGEENRDRGWGRASRVWAAAAFPASPRPTSQLGRVQVLDGRLRREDTGVGPPPQTLETFPTLAKKTRTGRKKCTPRRLTPSSSFPGSSPMGSSTRFTG